MKTFLLLLIAPLLFSTGAHAIECTNWQTQHPEWIWCDDFEDDSLLSGNYFEVVRTASNYGVYQGTALDGQGALKSTYVPGVSDAGNLKFSFGRTPVSPARYTNQDFEEIYWRIYVMHESGWQGNAHKLTRAIVFAGSNWSQAAIGHLWNNSTLGLAMEPVSGVSGSTVVTTGYNDFPNMSWLGNKSGQLEIFETENVGKWQCIEVHMALNTPGQSDGVLEFWIDGDLQASSTNLNFRGSYTDYGINAVFIENYATGGLSQQQSRYMDNFVISEQRINCQASNALAAPKPPSNISIQ